MKNIMIIWFILLVIATPICAQQAVSTAGASNSNSQGSVVYSVGEIATSTHTNSSGSLHEGVIQYYLLIRDELIQIPDVTISVFPNPVTSKLKVEISNPENISYSLFDISGNVLETNTCLHTNEINFEAKAQGTYILHIINSQSNISNSYSIIKQ